MIEGFNPRTWRNFYDQVQILGEYLKDTYPTLDKNGKKLPPVVIISEEEQQSIEADISILVAGSQKYLECCGMKPREPLWIYNIEDPRTHVSSDEFKFKHLMPGYKPISIRN